MDLSELRELAKFQALGPRRMTDYVDVSDKLTNAHINKALHIVESAALWKYSLAEAEFTVAKGNTLPTGPPTDVGVTILAFSKEIEDELVYVDDRQRVRDTANEGVVGFYTDYGGELRFYPPANKATTIVLRYYKTWPDLVNDTDTPVFPATWHHVLADYATSQLLLRMPQSGEVPPQVESQGWLNTFQSGLQMMAGSHLALPTLDAITNHAYNEMVWEGEQNYW